MAINEKRGNFGEYEQWQGKGLSIWATSSSLDASLKPLISSITNRYGLYGLPNFRPHITLFGSTGMLDQNQVINTAKLLDNELKEKPVPVALGDIGITNLPSKAIYVDVPKEQNPELLRFSFFIQLLLKESAETNNIFPHISLVYDPFGRLSQDVKWKIASEIKEFVPEKSYIDEISAYSTLGTIQEWKKLE